MITIKQVQAEISALKLSCEKASEDKIIKKLKKDIEFYRQIVLYLETEPKEDFLIKNLDKTRKKLASYKDSSRSVRSNISLTKKLKKDALSELLERYNPSILKLQIRALTYILKR